MGLAGHESGVARLFIDALLVVVETRVGLEVEVEAWLVLERQAPNLAVAFPHGDDLVGNDGGDFELMGEFFFVPDVPVGGFESLTILAVVSRHGSFLLCLRITFFAGGR